MFTNFQATEAVFFCRLMEIVFFRGFRAMGPDGQTRLVFPVLFSWLADYPEKLMLTGVKSNLCPKCKVPLGSLSDFTNAFPERETKEGVSSVEKARAAWVKDGAAAGKAILKPLGITETLVFCAEWQHSCVHKAMAPDRLHELEKGVFGTHLLQFLVAACENDGSVGAAKFNRRWKEVPKFGDLKIFKKPVSAMTMVTGKEYQQMLRVSVAGFYLVLCVQS